MDCIVDGSVVVVSVVVVDVVSVVVVAVVVDVGSPEVVVLDPPGITVSSQSGASSAHATDT
jgi:hypothetical protein